MLPSFDVSGSGFEEYLILCAFVCDEIFKKVVQWLSLGYCSGYQSGVDLIFMNRSAIDQFCELLTAPSAKGAHNDISYSLGNFAFCSSSK